MEQTLINYEYDKAYECDCTAHKGQRYVNYDQHVLWCLQVVMWMYSDSLLKHT